MADARHGGDTSEIFALGFSFWKKPVVRSFFPASRVVFTDDFHAVPAGAAVAVWGVRPLPAALEGHGRVWRLEDGFLRSVGLGADLIRPVSWVADGRGMYFDATRPSDLECLLSDTVFPPELLDRARALRERIVAARLTKYNVGVAAWARPGAAGRVILVPGQVESDASIAYGAPGIRTNLDLLQAVRAGNPDAYVLYKPHPDVVAGLRASGRAEDKAASWCDEIVTDAPMGDLLSQVDEVHVLTSLAGFEGLLRGKRVTCHGQPFYAGWGLTTDMMPVGRRSRRLSLDELVVGALILYPRYMHPQSGALISPEAALDVLLAWRDRTGQEPSWWRRLFRVVLRRVVGVR